MIGNSIGELGNAATNVAFPLVTMITTMAMTMLILSGFTIDMISFVFINPILTAFGGRGQTLEYALELLEQGKTYRQITAMTGISKSTLVRAKNQGA